MSHKPLYASNPDWADLSPIEQLDGGPDSLAEIAYPAEYTDAMGYLRAVMAAGERSERALELTERLILLNPSHYTVWQYRATIITHLNKDIPAELGWVNSIALKHQKNYQIWGYRQTLMESLRDGAGEQDFIGRMLALDAKNYHVWTYRQWLVRELGYWPNRTAPDASTRNHDDVSTETEAAIAAGARELADIDALIETDLRNNSAWNHRWYLLFKQPVDPSAGLDDPWKNTALVDREVNFAASKIALAPHNESGWNYLRALFSRRIELAEAGTGRAAAAVAEALAISAALALGHDVPTVGSASAAGTPTPPPSESVRQLVAASEAVVAAGQAGLVNGSSLAHVHTSFALELVHQLLRSDGAATLDLPEAAADTLLAAVELLDPIRAPYWAYLKSCARGERKQLSDKLPVAAGISA